MLSELDNNGRRISSNMDYRKRASLGQFLTPVSIAEFMAGLFHKHELPVCRILDPGAGIGTLSAAFLERWISADLGCSRVELTACEIEGAFLEELERTLGTFRGYAGLTTQVINADFIEEAATWLKLNRDIFTHAILNPPYKKMASNSRHRLVLRQAGIETVNLYSAFVALTLELMAPGGQLVAIIPRSFCNGPYYRPFREFLLQRAAIRRMHLFDARDRAFRKDGVLQENLIILLERGGRQGDVEISTSTDDSFCDIAWHSHQFGKIVYSDDPEKFIHVPTSAEDSFADLPACARFSLGDISIEVSTGPVVDFRMKEYLRDMPTVGTVPLIYPGHLLGQTVTWPKAGAKKPNAIVRNPSTERILFPPGYYCVVRRFSSKEERRRIVAGVVAPEALDSPSMIGFENHLNVFHHHKRGLPEALAYGLSLFLNTTAADKYFRRFSGHTQVNATDLRFMKYPSRSILVRLGSWAMRQKELNQDIVDQQFGVITS